MQTVQLKYDIISYVTGLNDKKLILKLYKLMKEQGTLIKFTEKSPPDFNMWGRW